MKIIDTKIPACTGCTRCLRKCEVKAIQLLDNTAFINDDLCIYCGTCLVSCPHGANFYLSDAAKIRSWLQMGKKMVLSLDPSYLGAFPGIRPGQIISAFRRIGFKAVHETSEAAAVTTSEYIELAKNSEMGNLITSFCPTVNAMIQIHYPDLLPYLAPVATPMLAHGRYLKEIYGPETLVVYAGPCISSKRDAYSPQNGDVIDAVLTFAELERFMKRLNIDMASFEDSKPDNSNAGVYELYPTAGGIITAFRNSGVFPPNEYVGFHASGLANCRSILQDIRDGLYSNCVIELSACPGGCVNGPVRPKGSSGSKNNLRMKQSCTRTGVTQKQLLQFLNHADVHYTYSDWSPKLDLPSDEEIVALMRKMGKKGKKDEMDCGACGYTTCREHAAAVLMGYTHCDTCIHYLHQKASSLSNLVMENTPNMIMILDNQLRIQEFSASCEKKFHITRAEALGKELFELMDDTDCAWALEHKQNLRNKVIELEDYNTFAQQNITYMKDDDALLVILIDITEQKKKEDEDYFKKLETVELAQKIIDKQMTAVQTIASLLGESTAESKIALNKLCRSLLGEEGGEN